MAQEIARGQALERAGGDVLVKLTGGRPFGGRARGWGCLGLGHGFALALGLAFGLIHECAAQQQDEDHRSERWN